VRRVGNQIIISGCIFVAVCWSGWFVWYYQYPYSTLPHLMRSNSTFSSRLYLFVHPREVHTQTDFAHSASSILLYLCGYVVRIVSIIKSNVLLSLL
jgi:hypothetical protein